MSAPRLLQLRVVWGTHETEFTFPERPTPVVILGPNGSGKTTLLEAAVRTLYGFQRRLGRDREAAVRREPWSGRAPEATLRLRTAGDVVRIHRDFRTEEVVATSEADDRERFRGEANPASGSGTWDAWRELVEGWLGFGTLEPYRATAWIGQGELAAGDLSDELLRLAAGGHRRVQAARQVIHDAHYAITAEPLAAGETPRRTERPLQRARRERDEAVARAEEAGRAEVEREPLRRRREELREALTGLENEIESLEAALRPLAERRALELERRDATERVRRLQSAREALREAERDADAARAACEALEPFLPADFDGRLRALDLLWERRAALRAEATAEAPGGTGGWRLVAGATGGLGAAVVGVVLLATGRTGAGGALLAAGIAAAAAALAYAFTARSAEERRRRERMETARQVEEIEAKIAAHEADLPDADDLAPETAERWRDRWRSEREARRRAEEAGRRLAGARARALEELSEAEASGSGDEDGRAGDSASGRRTGPEMMAPEAVSERLATALEAARERSARAAVRTEELTAGLGPLPDGVRPEVASVEAARRRRREERARLEEELRRVEIRLAERAGSRGSRFEWEEKARAAEARAADLEARAEAYRRAWRLLEEAHAAFRDRDQDRLVQCVSTQLRAAGGGRLGELVVEESLRDAAVRLQGRTVPLEAPPLSYGQRHLALLAIRLGAADFLAAGGVRPPLLVDDPFAHLDREHAAAVWERLRAAAIRRQVLVTTQDVGLLEALGVEADIQLHPPAPSAGAPPLQLELT